MALRLKYSQETPLEKNSCVQLIVKEDLKEAIETALNLITEEETLHIVPTYSAMLEVRGILTGRQIL